MTLRLLLVFCCRKLNSCLKIFLKSSMEGTMGLRKRFSSSKCYDEQERKKDSFTNDDLLADVASSATVKTGSYWLTRIVFLRALAVIYCE